MNVPGGLILRLATREDDAGLRAVLWRNPMPGAMQLAFTYEPDFFAAIEVEGDAPQVIVGEQEGRLVGAALSATRTVYLNGQPARVGYLGGLRADRALRGTTALARGYRFLHALHRERTDVPFSLSTIMEENVLARRLLTSGRAGLPAHHEIGRLCTLAFPLVRRRPARPPAGLEVCRGGHAGEEAIVDFLNAIGPARQFFPVYRTDDLRSPGGRLRGLSADDFLVAIAGDAIVGVLACWDQSLFRQRLVAGYRPPLCWLRPALNACSAPLGFRALPATGQPVRGLLAACLAIRGDDPAVFRVLLHGALAAHAGRDFDYLFAGLADGDPLLPPARERWHLALHSRIYAVEWGDGAAAVAALDGRPPYLELGSL